MDVRFDETNGSQREHLPNVLDEVPPSESIKLMGTGEIIPSEPQAEDELIIAPSQPGDNAQPKVNVEAEDSDLLGQNLRPVHPRVANEVQIEKIIDSINAPSPLTHSRATQLANFHGTLHVYQYLNPRKLMKPSWNLNGLKPCKKSFISSS